MEKEKKGKKESQEMITEIPVPGSAKSPIKRPFGSGDKGLIYMMSANPVTDPTSGSGTCHRDWAEALTHMGYDVVIIQSESKWNNLFGRVPYQIWDVPFNGRLLNPENKNGMPDYDRYRSAIPFNYLAFEAATRSSERFIDVDAHKLEAYYLSFAWAFRSATIVFGVPNMAWNGHVWVQNDITTSVPTIMTVHGTGAATKTKGGREKRYFPLVKRANGRAFAAAAISPQEYGHVTAFGFDPVRARIIPNGFNPRVFHPDRNISKASLVSSESRLSGVDPNDNWISFAGRAANFKGVDNLIKAFARTLDAEPDSRLLIMGSGDFSDIEVKKGLKIDCIQLAKDLGVADRIHFLGPVPQRLMADLINVSEAYALPSRKEPFGLTFPEGMASGNAPIVTRDGGFVDIVAQCAGIEKSEVRPGRYDFCTVVLAENRKSRGAKMAAAQTIQARDDLDPELQKLAVQMLMGEIKMGELDLSQGVNAQAVHLIKVTRWEEASERTVVGLMEAMLDDIRMDGEERKARGREASEVAFRHYSVGKMVGLRMEPLIREAIRSGGRLGDWDGHEDWTDLPEKRSSRLLRIGRDEDLRRAYTALYGALLHEEARDEVQVGEAWRRFDWEATRFFGSQQFLHPLDLEALPDLSVMPNGLMSELARGAGVTVEKMVEIMDQVSQIPWYNLTPPSVLHPQAFPESPHVPQSRYGGGSEGVMHGSLLVGATGPGLNFSSAQVFMNHGILPTNLGVIQQAISPRFFIK